MAPPRSLLVLALAFCTAPARARASAGDAPSAASPAAPVSVSGLPLHEVPSRTPGPRLALLITGDGGWVAADKALATALAEGGLSVVALDARRYFWHRRTPEETVRDTARILAHYRAAWGRDEVVLVGYSRGADALPVVLDRMAPADRAHVVLAALLGPATFAELEVHVIDLFSHRRRAGALDTEKALRATGGAVRILCFEGAREHDCLCPKLADLPWVTHLRHAGSHRLNRDEATGIGRDIVAALSAR